MLRADFKYISTYNCWQDTERIMPMNLLTDQGICSESHWEEEAQREGTNFCQVTSGAHWSASYSLTHRTPTLVSLQKGGCLSHLKIITGHMKANSDSHSHW